MAAVADLVHAPEKGDGLGILLPALLIGQPFACLARIVEVEHGGDRIDPKAVEVIALEPEERVVDEKTRDLAAAEVIDGGVPVGVKAAPRIVVLVEGGAVELRQAVLVGREMR